MESSIVGPSISMCLSGGGNTSGPEGVGVEEERTNCRDGYLIQWRS